VREIVVFSVFTISFLVAVLSMILIEMYRAPGSCHCSRDKEVNTLGYM
jgi:hypothetical protein